MRYWAFASSPHLYRLDDAIRELPEDTWNANTSSPAVGDRALIWRRAGQGRHRAEPGVVAFAEVITPPRVIDERDNPYWRKPGEYTGPKRRVVARYQHAARLPLLLDDHPLLHRLTVTRGRQTTFPITDEALWKQIVTTAGGWPATQLDLNGGIDAIVEGRTGAVADPARRRAIERRAMVSRITRLPQV